MPEAQEAAIKDDNIMVDLDTTGKSVDVELKEDKDEEKEQPEIEVKEQPVKEEIGRWKMTVNIGPYKRGEVPHISPSVYDKDTVYPAYYQMCKYYYDKRKK